MSKSGFFMPGLFPALNGEWMSAVRDLRPVSQDEFQAFLSSYPNPLSSRSTQNGRVFYEDKSSGDEWPDSLVASYNTPQPPKKPRASGWRIPAENNQSVIKDASGR